MQLLIGSLKEDTAKRFVHILSKACPDCKTGVYSNTHMYIEIKTKNLDQIILCLISIIVKDYIPPFVKNSLEHDYPFLTFTHQRQIMQRTISVITSNTNSHAQYNVIQDRLRMSLGEKSILNLDGFFQFRIRDITEKWKKQIDREVENFLKERQRENLLHTLKNYAEQRKPLFAYITVKEMDNGRYGFFEENGSRIITVFSQPKEYTPEEELINGLLYMSPSHLDLSGVNDKEMKTILMLIFKGRVQP